VVKLPRLDRDRPRELQSAELELVLVVARGRRALVEAEVPGVGRPVRLRALRRMERCPVVVAELDVDLTAVAVGVARLRVVFGVGDEENSKMIEVSRPRSAKSVRPPLFLVAADVPVLERVGRPRGAVIRGCPGDSTRPRAARPRAARGAHPTCAARASHAARRRTARARASPRRLPASSPTAWEHGNQRRAENSRTESASYDLDHENFLRRSLSADHFGARGLPTRRLYHGVLDAR
jgi:hypothetical protein